MNSGKTRKFYIDNLQVGNLVAFNYNDSMLSGKIQGIKEDECQVKTKNGSLYYISKESIAWVKNGTNWPVGIYNALKQMKGK